MEKQKDFKEEYFLDERDKNYKKMRKKRMVWAVVGVIMAILGITGAIPLTLSKSILGISISALMVIGGIILIAWALSD